jgi:hypothetical protein
MKKYLLDSNILLGFLLADHAELSPKASRLFQQAADRKCLLVLSEAVGVSSAARLMGNRPSPEASESHPAQTCRVKSICSPQPRIA